MPTGQEFVDGLTGSAFQAIITVLNGTVILIRGSVLPSMFIVGGIYFPVAL